MRCQIEFKIDAWTPDTLPQERFGAYLVEIAKLYGELGSVHFCKLKKGSAVLVSKIEEPAYPKVKRRLLDIRGGLAARDAVAVYKRIDDMLAEDNSIGTIRGLGRGTVIDFPGRTRTPPADFAPIRENTMLEGEIIRIGGKGKSVHITLLSGETSHSAIETTREMARRLGPLIFGPTVRLHGPGSWRRGPEGAWMLERLVVERFETMAERGLGDAIENIRAIRGSEWNLEADPVGDLLSRRAAEHT